ncbi:MAG: hypothetical protein PHW04_06790 [Candidatus Wallbacteria bacterium]|nr:hypothetical protein [Candidatus Wallbacteria bacterium]
MQSRDRDKATRRYYLAYFQNIFDNIAESELPLSANDFYFNLEKIVQESPPKFGNLLPFFLIEKTGRDLRKTLSEMGIEVPKCVSGGLPVGGNGSALIRANESEFIIAIDEKMLMFEFLLSKIFSRLMTQNEAATDGIEFVMAPDSSFKKIYTENSHQEAFLHALNSTIRGTEKFNPEKIELTAAQRPLAASLSESLASFMLAREYGRALQKKRKFSKQEISGVDTEIAVNSQADDFQADCFGVQVLLFSGTRDDLDLSLSLWCVPIYLYTCELLARMGDNPESASEAISKRLENIRVNSVESFENADLAEVWKKVFDLCCEFGKLQLYLWEKIRDKNPG